MNRRTGVALAAGIAGLLALALVAAGLQRTPAPDAGAEALVDRPWARVTLAAHGTLGLSRADTELQFLGNLMDDDPRKQREALERLRAALGPADGAASPADGRAPDGMLELTVDPQVPWDRALWILEVLGAPPLSLAQVRLTLPGDPRPPIPQVLAYGDGLALVLFGKETVPILLVQLGVDPEDIDGVEPPASRVSASLTEQSMYEFRTTAPSGESFAWRTGRCTESDVRRMAAEARVLDSTLEAAVLDVQRPLRHRMACGDVLTVLRALREEGIAPVWILHRTMTLPGDR